MINQIRGSVANNTFGMVRNGGTRLHQGWDLQTPRGMHCYAVADGTIARTDSGGDYGQSVTLEFSRPVGQARYAFYAHLSSILVRQGQAVSAGDPIGMVGVTGNAVRVTPHDSVSTLALPRRQDHLHFELRTVARPGAGREGRIDPKTVYGECPLTNAVIQLRE